MSLFSKRGAANQVVITIAVAVAVIFALGFFIVQYSKGTNRPTQPSVPVISPTATNR